MARLATIVDVVSDASLEVGITQIPLTIVVGSSDNDVAQLVALTQNVADELLIDPPYREQLADGNWLIDAGMVVRKARPTSDNDVVLFDARLMVNGLKYRFLKAKAALSTAKGAARFHHPP